MRNGWSCSNTISKFEGSWDKGGIIRFVGVDEEGNKGCMLSLIADHNPAQYDSIQHIGLVMGGQEITKGPDMEKWANGFENYTFSKNQGIPTVTVQMNASEDFEDYMIENYPQVFGKLKAVCEC